MHIDLYMTFLLVKKPEQNSLKNRARRREHRARS